MDSPKGKEKGYFYSEKEDILNETTRGYGDTEKPEDYLEAFTKFVNENKDEIEAIRIACTKPSDMTRIQLKRTWNLLWIKRILQKPVWMKPQAPLQTHIIGGGYYRSRQAVLKTPLFNHDERVEAAFVQVNCRTSF